MRLRNSAHGLPNNADMRVLRSTMDSLTSKTVYQKANGVQHVTYGNGSMPKSVKSLSGAVGVIVETGKPTVSRDTRGPPVIGIDVGIIVKPKNK